MSQANPDWNPTHEEIAAACAEIQKGWTAWQRYTRSGGLEKAGEFKWPAPRREVRVDEDAMGEVA